MSDFCRHTKFQLLWESSVSSSIPSNPCTTSSFLRWYVFRDKFSYIWFHKWQAHLLDNLSLNSTEWEEVSFLTVWEMLYCQNLNLTWIMDSLVVVCCKLGFGYLFAWRFLAAWILPGICARGRCVITNTSFLIPTFKCVCDPRYENVLNFTAGFCVNECMFLYLSAQVHIHLHQENVAMVLCDNSTNTFNIVNALPMVLSWTSSFPGVAGWVLEILFRACRWTQREL